VRRALLPPALLLAAVAPAAAAGGEAGGGIADLVWPAVNLAILLAALVYFGRAPVRDFFAARQGRIREGLDSAARALAEAESRYGEWQHRLVDLDAEIERVRTRARELAEAERDRLLADATAAADRIRADARVAVEQEMRRAREELRREAAELALELAAAKLRARIGDDDRSRLVDEFIDTVERGATGSPRRQGA
jgi:F-type H+-transporting ATPase subunit b